MAFKILWLRRFFRRKMKKLPEESAAIWKQRLSLGYMLLAWNAIGLITYMVYKGKADWAKDFKNEAYLKLTPAQQWSRTLGIENAKVIKVSGLNVSSYEIDNKGVEAPEQFINTNKV